MQARANTQGFDKDKKPSRAGILLFLVVVLILFLITSPVSAHPPSDIVLGYDTASQLLSVTISHDVSDPSTHYIYSVQVGRNGQGVNAARYTSQPERSSFTYTYSIPADPGDILRVAVDCSIGGSITKEIAVPARSRGGTLPPPLATGAVPVLWPYHAVLMGIGVILLLSAIYMVQYGRSRQGWYRYHRLLAAAGGFLVIVALIIAYYFVGLTGGPHLRVPHALLGISTITLVILTIFLGIARDRSKTSKARLRTIHLWCGRVLMILMIITIVAGLFTAGIL